MIEVEQEEVLRYLGYRGQQPDEQTQERLEHCLTELQKQARPKSVFRAFELTLPAPDMLKVESLLIHSRNLARNLKGCTCVYLMAATLGVDVDRLITRASAIRMSDAVIYQAAAAAMVESYCDEVNEALRREAETQGLYCRPRFSPGYGDFKIEHQRDLVRLLDTPRKIGLTVTDSFLLAPIKSVTAVIGLSCEPQPCHRRGCEECEKKNCTFRR